MKLRLRRRYIALVLCLALLFPAKPAKADSFGTDVVLVVVAIVAVSVVATVLIVHAAHHSPTVTGCVAAGADGMTIQNEGDQQSFLLTGDTAGIKAGDRVKVQGKKKSKDASGSRHFFVEKFKKDFGPCQVAPATP